LEFSHAKWLGSSSGLWAGNLRRAFFYDVLFQIEVGVGLKDKPETACCNERVK
jgi:hypothetical protein